MPLPSFHEFSHCLQLDRHICACASLRPSPCARRHPCYEVRGPAHPASPSWIPGSELWAREQALGSFSVCPGMKPSRAGLISVYLRSVLSAAAAAIGLGGRRGPAEHLEGPAPRLQAAVQALTCPTVPPLVPGDKASSRAFSVTQPRPFGPRKPLKEAL